MAYYTVCKYLHRDLYGEDQLVPAADVDNRFWYAVFYGEPYDGPIDLAIIEQCRADFTRFYPPQLRVSGKDLIYNHLIMSVYQHIAIFGSDMCCQEYLINGYAKLNGKKMSKSTGNFITLADALNQYRLDALRVMLIEAGDGLEDANVRLSEYHNVVRALDECYKMLVTEDVRPAVSLTDIDQLFLNVFTQYHRDSNHSFSCGKFREALTIGWRTCYKTLQYYQKYPSYSAAVAALAKDIIRRTLALVVGGGHEPEPEPSAEMDVEMPYSVQSSIQLYEYLQSLDQVIRRTGSNISTPSLLHVRVHIGMAPYAQLLQEHIMSRYGPCTISYDYTVLHPNRSPYKVKPTMC